MLQAEGMTALLTHLMEKNEKERKERERNRRDCLEFEVRQLELDRKLHNKKSRQAVCQQLNNWDNSTDPIAYLYNFNLVIRDAKISQEEWVNLIRKQLKGKALSAFQEDDIKRDTSYKVFKSMILEQMGATVDKARRTVLLAKPSVEEHPEILLRNVLQSLSMLKEKLATPERAMQEIFQR